MIDAREGLERAVIGCIIRGTNEGEIFPDISPDEFMFYPDLLVELRRQWQKFGKTDEITIKTLGENLKEDAALCLEGRINPSDGKIYVKALRENIAEIKAKKIAFDIFDTNCRFADIEKHAQDILQAVRFTEQTNVMGMEEGLLRFMDQKARPREYIKTGYSIMDKYLYLDKGDYMIIGARPSVGKTAFAVTLAYNMAKKGQKVVFFSLETSKDKIMDRLVTSICGLDYGEVKRQEMDHEEWVKVSRASDEIVKLPLNIVEAGGINATGIQSEALRLNADVIIIDYIGLMKSEGNSRYEKMTNISIDLHTLAQQKKITVIGLSQLNRGGAENKPSMEDLRESGQIEQDADVILLMHKIVNETEVQVDINIAKNKEGETGIVPMRFHGRSQRFSEIEIRYGR